MTQRNTWLIATLTLLFFFTTIVGCGKVNQQNLDKVKAGMSYEEVVKILGNPSNCDSVLGGKSCVWKSGNKMIDVKFLSDKVIFYAGKNLGG